MNNTATSMELLIEKAEEYSKTSLELYKLKLLDKSANTISLLATHLLFSMVVALCLLFISIGCSFYIASQLGNFYSGFFIVGGAYLLLALFFYIFRISLLKNPLNDALIAKIENKIEHETKSTN